MSGAEAEGDGDDHVTRLLMVVLVVMMVSILERG